MGPILSHISKERKAGRPMLAVLLDPDEYRKEAALMKTIDLCNGGGVDLIFVGGSLVMRDDFDQFVKEVRSLADMPVVLFPGSPAQLSDHADALLFLSLISGRNPEYLIGAQVASAPIIAETSLEVIPTGYMLIDCGNVTTAHYISQTSPIPHDKSDIAYATALAGTMLGMQCIYMDGGSGAARHISREMISAVNSRVDVPLIIGGGIRSVADIEAVCAAGADVVVIGNAIEEDKDLIQDFSIAVHRPRTLEKN